MSRFGADQRGATVVEYGLIAALIFLAIVASVTTFSTNTDSMFTRISDAITGANGGG